MGITKNDIESKSPNKIDNINAANREPRRRILAAFLEVKSHITRKSVAHIRRHTIVDYVGVRVVRKSENKAVKRIDENPCEHESYGNSDVLRAYSEHAF